MRGKKNIKEDGKKIELVVKKCNEEKRKEMKNGRLSKQGIR